MVVSGPSSLLAREANRYHGDELPATLLPRQRALNINGFRRVPALVNAG